MAKSTQTNHCFGIGYRTISRGIVFGGAGESITVSVSRFHARYTAGSDDSLCNPRSFLGAESASAISAVFDHASEESDILIRKDPKGVDSSSKVDDAKLKLPVTTNGSTSRDISQQKTRVPETPTKARGTASTKGSARSPLTQLWGREKGNESTELVTSREEVDDLRSQLREMRESQARMEALLRGMSKA